MVSRCSMMLAHIGSLPTIVQNLFHSYSVLTCTSSVPELKSGHVDLTKALLK